MKLMEDVFINDSIEINTTPEKIFKFLENLKDDKSYCAWHPKDHKSMKWIEGEPWKEGSIVYAEEYLNNELHKLKFTIIKYSANKEIVYVPTSRFLRRYVPRLSFLVEKIGEKCVFKASMHYRSPLLLRLFAKRHLKKDLNSVKKHMKEEGENIKYVLENESI